MLTVSKGNCYVIIGANGSGKSTTTFSRTISSSIFRETFYHCT